MHVGLVLVLYPLSPSGLSCTLKCDPVPGRVVRVWPCPSVYPSRSNKVVRACCLLACVLVVSLCVFRRKVDSAFSKIQIKQLKHHLILIPISQKLYPIYRRLPDAVQEPPTVGTLQPLAQEDRKMGTDRTLLRKNKK